MNPTIPVFLVLCTLANHAMLCKAVEFTDCGSTVGKFDSISVSGCNLAKPACDLVRGTNASIDITFTTDKEMKNVSALVYGILMDIPIPFPLPNAAACLHPQTGITCPVPKGGPYHYKATLPVLKQYPKLSVLVKWELVDEDGNMIVCVHIPTKITD